MDVTGGRECILDKCASFFLDAAIKRGEHTEQIAFGLVGDHLENVGQMLTFNFQLDDISLDYLEGIRKGFRMVVLSSKFTVQG